MGQGTRRMIYVAAEAIENGSGWRGRQSGGEWGAWGVDRGPG